MSANSPRSDRVTEAIYTACVNQAAESSGLRVLNMNRIGWFCQRALWHEINSPGPSSLNASDCRAANWALAAETRIIAELRAAGFVIDHQGQNLSDFAGRFRGRCQGVIHGVTKEPHLLVISAVSAAEYQVLARPGAALRAEYLDSLQCHLGYLGLRRALWVVENSHDLALRSERLMLDAARFTELKARAEGLLSLAVAPPAARSSRCIKCFYQKICGPESAVSVRPSSL